ncbi:MAG: hypothetical protein ACRDKU_02365 [Gaiellaceae bacterium]
MLGRFWQKLRGGARSGSAIQLERDDDPRGGLQSDEYRSADSRDVVEEGGTVMSGPGGAPQEGESPLERRQRDRD